MIIHFVLALTETELCMTKVILKKNLLCVTHKKYNR